MRRAATVVPRTFAASLVKDQALRAAVLAENPRALEVLPGDLRNQLLTADQALAARYQRQLEDLRRLGIRFPERLRPPALLRELIANRSQPRPPSDKRPLALAIFSTSDFNGAFEQNSLADLTRAYRVLYVEVSSDEELLAALETHTRAEPAALLLIGGHGEPKSLRLGEDQRGAGRDRFSGDRDRSNEQLFLDREDGDQIGDRLRRAVARGGHIVLKSCSTGSGGYDGYNLASTVAALAPQAYVHAPLQPTNNRLQLDAQGRFAAPGFWHGASETLTIAPRQ